MLFSNDFTPSLNPYVSSYLNDPAYLAALHKLQKKQTGAEVGFGIGEGLTAIGGAVGSAAATYFGGPIAGAAVGAAAAAAESGLGAGEKGRLAKINTQIGDLKKQYIAKDDINDPQIGAHVGNTNTFGNLGSIFNGLGQNKGFMQLMQGLIQRNNQNAFAKKDDAATNALNKSQLDTTTPYGNGTLGNNAGGLDTSDANNFDFSQGTGTGITSDAAVTPITQTGFWKGGLAPLGKDDIALVDTKDGSDTGIRLQAGEMLVVSRKTLDKLNSALKDGDHKEVYDLMKAQVKVAPTVKDGMRGRIGGGGEVIIPEGAIVKDSEGSYIYKGKEWHSYNGKEVGRKLNSTEAANLPEMYKTQAAEEAKNPTPATTTPAATKKDGGLFWWEKALGEGAGTTKKTEPKDYGEFGKKVSALSDKEFAALAKHNIQNKLTGMSDLIQQEAEKRGLTIQGGILDPVTVKKGKDVVAPDTKFDATKFTQSDQGFPFAPQVTPKTTLAAPATTAPVEQKIEDTYTAPLNTTGAGDPVPPDYAGFFKNKKNDAPIVDDTPVPGSDQPVADLGITKSDYPLNITPPDQKESNTGLTAGDYAKYYAPEALGTGFDIARGVLGFNAANKPLPTFTKPEAWNQYVNRLHGLSETGLTGNEMTAAQRGIDQTYAYDVDNIRNLSGGNSGQALGNLGRAASSHYGALTNLAALNDEARARNLGQYGEAVQQDTNLNRMIFNDKYSEAQYQQQAGGQLLHDSISNIKERVNTDKEYSPGSYYDQINRMNLQEKQQAVDYNKQFMANIAKNGFITPPVGSSAGADPTYADYMEYKKWKESQKY